MARAHVIDRHVRGGIGVVGDDLVAGVYAGVARAGLLWLLGRIGVIERAVILSTGDELTTGRIVDTNAELDRRQAVRDRRRRGRACSPSATTRSGSSGRGADALELADVVISTGGIGPTADDLTSETVARVLGVPLVEDAAVGRPHPALLRSRGRRDAAQQPEAGARCRGAR